MAYYLNFLFSLIRDFVSNSLIAMPHNEAKLTCDVNPDIMYDCITSPLSHSSGCQVVSDSDDAHILFRLSVVLLHFLHPRLHVP